MGREIERKFLVSSSVWKENIIGQYQLRQGYMTGAEGAASVRVRIQDDEANLNIKSRTIGISRDEYEYPVPVEDAELMLSRLCYKPLIEKIRYHVMHDENMWEIDVFSGENEGLIVAEIELSTELEVFNLPSWAGSEVSHLPRYFNASLIHYPYCVWAESEKVFL